MKAFNYTLLILPHGLKKYTHFTPFHKYRRSHKKTASIEKYFRIQTTRIL